MTETTAKGTEKDTTVPSAEDRFLDLWEENIRLTANNASRPKSRTRND